MINKNKVTQRATNTAVEKKWVINTFSKQLTNIKTDLLSKCLNFSITLKKKTLSNKDIIATIEETVMDLEKEGADTICTKINQTL